MPIFALIWLSSTLALNGLSASFCPSALRLMTIFEALVLPYLNLPIRITPSALRAFSALKSVGLLLAFLSAGLAAMYWSASSWSIFKSNVYSGLAKFLMPTLPLIWLLSTFTFKPLSANWLPSALTPTFKPEMRYLS